MKVNGSRILDQKERVRIFNHIRDLPYEMNFLHPWRDHSAIGKTQMLRDEFERYGIHVRPICCQFRWDSTSIPREIYRVAAGSTSMHTYPEILIPETGQWVAADPTFDSGLKNAGLPVAEWDGLNPTILAVSDPFRVLSPKQSEAKVDDLWDEMTSHSQDMHEAFGPAAKKFNEWFNQQRRRQGSCVLHA